MNTLLVIIGVFAASIIFCLVMGRILTLNNRHENHGKKKPNNDNNQANFGITGFNPFPTPATTFLPTVKRVFAQKPSFNPDELVGMSAQLHRRPDGSYGRLVRFENGHCGRLVLPRGRRRGYVVANTRKARKSGKFCVAAPVYA